MGVVIAVPRPVVAVGPERHARARILDRRVIVIAAAASRIPRHDHVVAAVHRHGVGLVIAVPRPVVAVGPERHARARILDRRVIVISFRCQIEYPVTITLLLPSTATAWLRHRRSPARCSGWSRAARPRSNFKITTHIPGFFSTDEPFGNLWRSWYMKYSVLNHISFTRTILLSYPFGLNIYGFGLNYLFMVGDIILFEFIYHSGFDL